MYITTQEVKDYYWITWTDQDLIIEMFIKENSAILDNWNPLYYRNLNWKQLIKPWNTLINFNNVPVDEITEIKLVNTDNSEEILSDNDYMFNTTWIIIEKKTTTVKMLKIAAKVWFFEDDSTQTPADIKVLLLDMVWQSLNNINTASLEERWIKKKTIWKFSVEYDNTNNSKEIMDKRLLDVQNRYNVKNISINLV